MFCECLENLLDKRRQLNGVLCWFVSLRVSVFVLCLFSLKWILFLFFRGFFSLLLVACLIIVVVFLSFSFSLLSDFVCLFV